MFDFESVMSWKFVAKPPVVLSTAHGFFWRGWCKWLQMIAHVNGLGVKLTVLAATYWMFRKRLIVQGPPKLPSPQRKMQVHSSPLDFCCLLYLFWMIFATHWFLGKKNLPNFQKTNSMDQNSWSHPLEHPCFRGSWWATGGMGLALHGVICDASMVCFPYIFIEPGWFFRPEHRWTTLW